MKIKYTFTYTLLLFFTYSHLFGQVKNKPATGTTISGTVIDKGLGEPLPFVTITVKTRGTAQIISGQITDSKGGFSIDDVPVGEFVLEFQFIGYQMFSRNISVKDRKRIHFGQVFLEEDATVLEGVEVIAEQSTIEQKVDRKVINIGKDLATTGPTAADLMVNIPSVNVDPDGGISLRGNDNVRILVDGKPTNLSASQLLQQIPSASIKSIELITNPSAKFIPDGMSGIINIVLHKNTNLGLNGNVSTGFTFGQEFRFSGSGDINYKTGKLNLFANYGRNHGLSPVEGKITRPRDSSNEVWDFVDDPVSHLFKTGLDYAISDRTVLSAYTIQNVYDNNASRFTSIKFPNDEQEDLSQRYLSTVENRTSTYNLDIKHTLTGSRGQVEFEVDYSKYSGEDNAVFAFEGPDIVNENAEENIFIVRENMTVNLDYTKSIGENRKLELGGEARLQRINNEYLTTNPNLNNSTYDFDRDIYSGYLSYSHSQGSWSYQVGARLEGFDMLGYLVESGEDNKTFDSPTFSVYPSAFLSYVPDPDKQRDVFNLSLSRRVDRPNLDQVTPIRVWSSPRITNIGNPALVPQFTNSVELNYTRQLKEGSITAGVFFRKIHDEIVRFGFNAPDNPENILFSYNNYRDNSSYGFELSGNYKPTSFWSFTSSFDLYTQVQQGVIQGEFRKVRNTLYSFRMNHSFKASKKLTFQVVNLYRGPNTNLQYKRLAFHFVNVGGRYTIMDGNGTISINFNDIFKTQQNSFEGERPVLQEGVFAWDSRTFFVGYSHRFGNGKNQALKRKKRDKNETRSGGF